MKISAVIIAKNEEKTVRITLESVKDFDEIIFVDTGSTDGTVAIARDYTDKIYNFAWCDDFSKARNFANSKATGDWIYSIDCDHELLTSYKEVKKEAVKADKLGHKSVMVKSISGKHEHWREVLFKNSPEVKWVGAIHECLTPPATYKSAIERKVGYSDNHKVDPDRNLRILLSQPKTERIWFYLGREYFEKRQFEKAIKSMVEYLKTGKWTPEKGEAYLTIAKSYWLTNQGDKAREYGLKAININPDFKEALQFMADTHYSPWREKWARLASIATNADVLFIRN